MDRAEGEDAASELSETTPEDWREALSHMSRNCVAQEMMCDASHRYDYRYRHSLESVLLGFSRGVGIRS